MQPPPDRLESLLDASEARALSPAERAELAGLLRECGRMDEADTWDEPADDLPTPEPTPEPPAMEPEDFEPEPDVEPLMPRWMMAVAVVGALCVLLALGLPWWIGRHQERSERVCRERLQRVSFALRLTLDVPGAVVPPASVDLAKLLANYQITPSDLRCPSGATYRLNPELAGRRLADVAELAGVALLVETKPDGSPATPHHGRCLGVLTNGWVGEMDSLARGSLTAKLPVPSAAPSMAPPPAWSPPAAAPRPAAPPAATGTSAPTATAPPAVAPPRSGNPRDIPPTEPERPNAAGPGTGTNMGTRRASAPEVLPGDSTPPDTKAWQTVLNLEGHDLTTSQPFAVGEQGRVRFETTTNALGAQPFRLLLVDEVGARPLRVLAVGVGPSKGVADIGAEGRFRVRVISVQPWKVWIEDRR